MTLLPVFYSLIAGVALTIGVVQLIIWGGHNRRRASLISSGMALAACAGALLELAITQTSEPAMAGQLLRWSNLSVALTLLCMVWFVRAYLLAGRSWLLWSITVLWLVGLVINFNSAASLTFKEIQSLRQLETFWGEPYYQVVGTTNPLKYMADLASLLIMIFVVDASWTAWRRGARRAAATIGGSITFFIVVAGIHTPLVDVGLVQTPTIISVAFVAILAAMSYEIARDVSRSHSLMDELRVGAERWRSLFETVGWVVLDIDAEGRTRYANPFYLTLGGVGQADVVGRPVSDLLQTRAETPVFEQLRLAADSESPQEVRVTMRNQAGEKRQLALNVLSLGDAEGHFTGVLCVAADITEKMAASQKLTRTRLKLDRIMRSNLLGEFASSLAHELNQPLAAILANAQVAQRYLNQDSPKVTESLAVLHDIVQDDRRAADLIAQMRALVQQNEVKREPLDLIQVLDETLALVKRELENHEINLTRDFALTTASIMANRVEMQQVLLNLLLNAMQVMAELPAAQRKIIVSITQDEEAVQVAIQDSGPGLSDERLETVFEAFNTGRNENMGLGLTICRRIVEAHGGLIVATNNPEVGATFRITLPLRLTDGEAHDHQA